jgi:predicted nuclease of predicted toxin-antitoxin system
VKGFLFDQNLPLRIRFTLRLPLVPLSDAGPAPTDTEVWNFARQRRLAIVSKDADFSERIITSTPPPWVVHLRFGNLRRSEFHSRLARAWPQVEALLKTHKLVNVYLDRVEGVN